MTERALVTGASGAIGRAVVDELARRGFAVDAWDIVEPSSGPTVTGSSIDLRASIPPDRVRNYRLVAHLASCTENRDDRSALSDHLGTVAMTVNLLEALGATPPGVVFATSSQLVYAPGDPTPDEDSALRAGTGFAAGKIATEAFLEAYNHRTGIPTVAFRLANIVGPGTNRGVIHDFVRRAAEAPSGSPVRITGSTHHRRSFLSVSDCAAAMVHWALSTTSEAHEAVNVGNVDSISIAGIAEVVADATGVGFEIERDSDALTWRGDAGTVLPGTTRLIGSGWAPDTSSEQTVRDAALGIWQRRTQ